MAGKTKAGQPDWRKIRARYERGGISYRELADKSGVSFHTLAARAKREGWQVSRDAVCDEIATKTRQIVVDTTAIQAADVIEMAKGFFTEALRKAEGALQHSDQPKDIKASIESGKLAVEGLKQALGITGDQPPAQPSSHDNADDLTNMDPAERRRRIDEALKVDPEVSG